jgi:phosphohistidine phosphatase
MRLYVMRHGPAEDLSATGRDEDRELTPQGRDRVRDVVRLLVREGEMPGQVLTSPLVRASQTADLVIAAAKAGGWEGAAETAYALAPGGNGVELVWKLQHVAAVGPMIVGHEPDLSSLVATLLGQPAPLPMDKAMVVALDIGHGPTATLRFIVDPRTLALVHDARDAREP